MAGKAVKEILKTVVESVEGSIGDGIVDFFANLIGLGSEHDDKSAEILESIQDLKKDIKTLSSSIEKAIDQGARKTKVVEARDKFQSIASALKGFREYPDKNEYQKQVKAIGDPIGVTVNERLLSMNNALMDKDFDNSLTLLEAISVDGWTKLQSSSDTSYTVRDYENAKNLIWNYCCNLEQVGFGLKVIYTNNRKPEDRSKDLKIQDNTNAAKESLQRMIAWREALDRQDKDSRAYAFLLDKMKNDAQESPCLTASLIIKSDGSNLQQSESVKQTYALDARQIPRRDNPVGWVPHAYDQPEPSQYWAANDALIPRVEWIFDYDIKTGYWTISASALGDYIKYRECKIIPLINKPSSDMGIMVSITSKDQRTREILGRELEIRFLLPKQDYLPAQINHIRSWAYSSSRLFVGCIENQSDYILIPTNIRISSGGDPVKRPSVDRPQYSYLDTTLHGNAAIYDSPVLPNCTTYVAGQSQGVCTGATALFRFAIWKCDGVSASNKDHMANVLPFMINRTYGKKINTWHKSLEIKASKGTLLGFVTLMGSTPYSAWYSLNVSEHGANQFPPLEDVSAMTGGHMGITDDSYKGVNVDVDYHMQETSTVFAGPQFFFTIKNKTNAQAPA